MNDAKNNVPKLRFSGFTDDWEQRKLGEITEISSGQNVPNEDGGKYYNLTMGSVNTEGHLVCSLHTNRSDRLLVKGTLIMPTRDVGAGYVIGRTAVIDENDKYYAGNCLYCLSTGLNEPYYIHHYMNSEMARKSMQIIVAGGSQKQITLPGIKSIEVPICSIEEQRKIAQLFNDLDKTITLHQRKLDEMKQFKSGMLQKMFPKDGEKAPELRFSGFTDDWEQCKFGEVTVIKSASRVHKEEWTATGVPFYRSSDVMSALNGTENTKAFISEELYEKLSAVSGKLEEGDVLVTGGGSVGNPYIVPNNDPLYTKDADLLWVKRTERLNPDFVYHFFLSPVFRDYLSSVSHVGTIAHYTITQLENTPIALPSIEEQSQIGAFFTKLDETITLHQRKLDAIKEYKKGLLQQMFV